MRDDHVLHGVLLPIIVYRESQAIDSSHPGRGSCQDAASPRIAPRSWSITLYTPGRSARSHDEPVSESGIAFDAGPDPRRVFLSAQEVIARYRWGHRRGYQNLQDRELVPPPVVRHPDRWRLDQLLANEDRHIALSEKEVERLMAASQPTAPDRESEPGAHRRMATLLPQPKQQHRRSA
ncbi:hypothetical protein GCM10009789_68140 [Kribbella sancticallisti]|uniref:Uncharacterized protein n=1 Tax=Kribbella sancticallisti TaxID=460087 RepID=A0ABN2EGI0_9ACTN